MISHSSNSTAPLLEVCVDSPDGVIAAEEGGAGRVELCSALELGGLTPTLGAVEQACARDICVFAMVRPRAGDFVYSAAEIDAMLKDIDCMSAGAVAGFVFGVLDRAGRLDPVANAELIDACGTRPATLHRAFDLSRDMAQTLEQAIELGFARILSSGGQPTAPAGQQALAAMLEQARERIVIMPGSGLTAANVVDFLAVVGAREVHASCKMPLAVPDMDLDVGRGAHSSRCITDGRAVRKMVEVLQGRLE